MVGIRINDAMTPVYKGAMIRLTILLDIDAMRRDLFVGILFPPVIEMYIVLMMSLGE